MIKCLLIQYKQMLNRVRKGKETELICSENTSWRLRPKGGFEGFEDLT